MTRKEEREQAARKYINCNAVAPENMQLAYGDFIEGAMWADATAWKPSEEQIEALESAIADAVSSIQMKMLNSLYQELKKLKEE